VPSAAAKRSGARSPAGRDPGSVTAVEVRLARSDDAEAIRAIYNLEVTSSTVTFDLVPRSAEAQEAWLAARSGAHAAVVALDGGEVVGFGSLSPYRDRPAYATTVEDSVYVRRDRQGAGVGKALLGELVELARVHGFHAVMARIVGGHEASIALHRAHGFDVVGVEREVGRKFGRWLDVVVMQRLLAEPAPPGAARGARP
jgi:L-amino acid N-acyltransferase